MADRAYEAINTQVIDQQSVTDTPGESASEQAPAASQNAMGGSLEIGGAQALTLALKQHLTIAEGVPPASSQKVSLALLKKDRGPFLGSSRFALVYLKG